MVSTPYPGTEMWEIAKRNGTINDDDLSNFTFYAPTKLPFSSNILRDDEIVKLYKRAYRSFYLRPGFILKQITKIKGLSDIQRNWMAIKGVLGV